MSHVFMYVLGIQSQFSSMSKNNFVIDRIKKRYSHFCEEKLSNLIPFVNWAKRGLSELVRYNECVGFFDEVLKLDKNIRFVAIQDGRFKAKNRTGTLNRVSEEEIKSSLFESLNFQNTFKKTSFKIDVPKFMMSQHDEINRIMIPFGIACVIIVTTDLDIYVDRLVDDIVEICTGFLNQPV